MSYGHVTANQLTPEERRAVAQFLAEWSPVAAEIGDEIRRLLAEQSVDVASREAVRAAIASRFDEREGDIVTVIQGQTREGVVAGRTAQARRFSFAIDFDRVPRRAIEQLDDWAVTASESVRDTLEEEATNFIRGAFREGADIPSIADEFQEWTDGRLTGSHAEQLARDATIGPARVGEHTANQDAAGVVAEQWDTTLDGRERDSHHDANGQIVLVGGNFSVGDDLLAHPKDPAGSVEETTNCRCNALPVFADDLDDDELETLRAGGRITKGIVR